MKLTSISAPLSLSLLVLAACGGISSADQLFDGRAGSGGSTAGSSGKSGGVGVSGGAGAAGAASGGSAGASQAGAPGSSGSSMGTAGAGVGGKAGSGGAGFGGKGGKGGAPSADCSSQGDNCQQCCDDQSNGVVTQAFILACGCAMGAECAKACTSNLCGGKQPSMQCAGCLNNIDDAAPCVAEFQQACQDDPKCAAAIPCFQACP